MTVSGSSTRPSGFAAGVLCATALLCVQAALALFFLGVCPDVAVADQGRQAWERIVAIVNDEPISEFDIQQRMRLMRAMGAVPPNAPEKETWKKTLDLLINEQLQRQEAKRLKFEIKKEQVDGVLGNMAKSIGGLERLKQQLAKNDVGIQTLKQQVEATLSWGRIVRGRFSALLKITDAEVERRYQQHLQNPRPPDVYYVMLPIRLPLPRNPNQALIQSRLAEANIIMNRFKGCGRVKSALEGIFDVHSGQPREIPAAKMPPKMRRALDKAGPGSLMPPGMQKGNLEMIAYCRKKKVPKPPLTRKQIRETIFAEQIKLLADRYVRDLRRDAVIEYR